MSFSRRRVIELRSLWDCGRDEAAGNLSRSLPGAAAGGVRSGRESYDPPVNKDELHAQIDQMTEEEAAEVKLIFAPDWPSKATSIEEIRKRTGTAPIGSEEFDRHFGSLPTDGEG